MDARRFNDTAKIAGTAIGILGLFGPVLTKPHASLSELVMDLAAQIPAALGLFLAGFGTRGKGMEYQDVADAKAVAKASMMPPPLPTAEDGLRVRQAIDSANKAFAALETKDPNVK